MWGGSFLLSYFSFFLPLICPFNLELLNLKTLSLRIISHSKGVFL
ncbi:hypothetical protein HMPREF4655_20004 [Helicobacter pylori 35A]|nr:hypothetical protein HMPREF4655_20004 [Helicobacter pylori 35A]